MPLCHPSDATEVCPARYEAIRSGVIWYSAGMDSWLCLNHLGVPVKTSACPWCGKAMPSLRSVAEKLLELAPEVSPDWTDDDAD